MKYIEDMEVRQLSILPLCIDEWITKENPVRVSKRRMPVRQARSGEW